MTALNRRALPAGLVLEPWTAPDGWRHRRFGWSPQPGRRTRGSLLFQAGRADFVEKYFEPLAHWHEHGWALAGFDWRGQGGSGRLSGDPATGHLASLDALVEDLAAFVAEWLAETPAPHVLVGHSMGGHLILRLLAERRPTVAAAVLVAPMLGLNSRPLPGWAVRALAWAAIRAGRAERPAWKHGSHPAAARALQRRLTHCSDRHGDYLWWRQERPELALGPPSWSWLAAAYASIARLARAGVLEAVATPMLLLGTWQDRLVSAAAIRRAAARLPDARLVMVGGAAHELLRETDAIRVPLIAAIDRFLTERAPQL